jgi:hypothetical protein
VTILPALLPTLGHIAAIAMLLTEGRKKRSQRTQPTRHSGDPPPNARADRQRLARFGRGAAVILPGQGSTEPPFQKLHRRPRACQRNGKRPPAGSPYLCARESPHALLLPPRSTAPVHCTPHPPTADRGHFQGRLRRFMGRAGTETAANGFRRHERVGPTRRPVASKRRRAPASEP